MAKKETKIDLMEPGPAKDLAGVPSAQKEKGPSLSEVPDKSSGKKSKKYFFFIGLIGFIFLVGALGTAGYLGYLSIPGISTANPPEPNPSKKAEMGEPMKLSPLIINLNEENGRHYLKTTIVLELEEKKWADTVQSRMSVFTDSVIMIVSDKKLEELKTNDFKERLKEELLNRFNELLGQKGVRRIYFDEFLFQ